MERPRRICATMAHHFSLAATDEAYRARRRRIETFTRAARPAPRSQVLIIPVVVHVIHRNAAEDLSEAQVHSQVEALNEDFRLRNPDRTGIPAPFGDLAGDALVEFVLARRDPDGIATSGITRTRTTASEFPYDGSAGASNRLDRLIKFAPTGAPAWPREDYLNLWACPLGDGLLGYAQFPGGKADTDGVVVCSTAFGRVGNVMADYDLGRTCVHEVGHWLNLLHVWGDDGGSCEHSDNVADTPNQAGPNAGKPSWPSASCGNAPDGDMFMNFMDYVDDASMLMFSRGQVERMSATLAGPRASLAVSTGGLAPGAGDAASRRPTTASAMLAALAPRGQESFDGVDWR